MSAAGVLDDEARFSILSGLLGAIFIIIHRCIAKFQRKNRIFKAIFGRK